MLAQYQGQVAVLAGGTDLLIWNYIQKKSPAFLLSLAGLNGLDVLQHVSGEGLRIGAKTKIAHLLENSDVAAKYPALYEAAYNFATPQIRNMATVMGNLLRGSPAGDCSCAILALGGQVVLQGPEGQRVVSVDDFWLGYGTTACRSNELAVEIRIPEPDPSTCSAFQRLTRVHEDLAKLNVAVRCDFAQGTLRNVRIAMGCVGPVPQRLKGAEALLEGAALSEELLRQVAESVKGEVRPIDDQRSTAEYRRQVSGVILRRTIERAVRS